MILQFASGSPLLEGLWAGGVLIAFILVAWLVQLSMGYIRRKLGKRPKAALIRQLLQSLSRPISLLVISQGFLLALSSLSYLAPWRSYLGKAAIAFAIILVTYGLARSGRLLLGWYLPEQKYAKASPVSYRELRYYLSI